MGWGQDFRGTEKQMGTTIARHFLGNLWEPLRVQRGRKRRLRRVSDHQQSRSPLSDSWITGHSLFFPSLSFSFLQPPDLNVLPTTHRSEAEWVCCMCVCVHVCMHMHVHMLRECACMYMCTHTHITICMWHVVGRGQLSTSSRWAWSLLFLLLCMYSRLAGQ